MLVLGVESTCDETAIALVRNGKTILSSVIASQAEIHRPFGGVIPELACREHINRLLPLLHQALQEAGHSLQEIDLIAVANGPGLIGALLIGVNFAKGLSLALQKPLVGVNHVEAHLYAPLMEHAVPFPALGMVVSGGHTALVKVKALGEYELIGQTQDDAIGEAFDKVAKLLELPYPGGPEIEKLARQGDPSRYPFKGGTIKKRPYDFSFSGLKTAVLYQIRGQNASQKAPLTLTEQEKADIAASFQHAAFSNLVEKALLVAQEKQCVSFLVGGGVSQNRYLRGLLEKKSPLPVFWPHPHLCLDNAAMIAGLGYHQFRRQGGDTLELPVLTRIPFHEVPTTYTDPLLC